nr:tRNA lysidine(34) synthetase TilS [uncultured Allomuricauda sp.]
MLQKFQRHIHDTFSFLKEKKLLLACSGGLDSVVLTHLCVQSNLNITLAHCNFRLRGGESNEDEVFVKQLAGQLRVEYVSVVFDTLNSMSKMGGSVQMVARKLRYEWFESVLDERKLDYVLTAHHADDALETFIINLSRGTGIDGLSGIPEFNGKILRPLLPFSRQEILEYAKSENFKWREDSSNSESKYLRNKIRKDIVPRLKELHPTFLDNFLTTQSFLSQSKAVLQNRFKEVKEKIFKDEGSLIRIQLADLHALQPLEIHLYGLLKSYGFTEWGDVKSLLDTMSGKEIHSQTHRLLKDRDSLLLQPRKEKSKSVFFIEEDKNRVEHPISLHFETTAEFEKLERHIVFLDKEKLNYPLTLRKWEKGDYFYPLGMQGKKKLSKFFKDERMDVFSKEAQWLLCSGEDIVWVIGKRADERYKIDGNTTQIVKITYST